MINLKPDITAQVAPVTSDLARSSSSNSSSEDNTITGASDPEQVKQQMLAKKEQLRSEEEVKEEEKVREEKVDETVADLNSSIQGVQRNLAFSVDKDLGHIVVNVTDKKTDEIIRQIPSEDFLDLARNLQDMLNSKDSAQSTNANSAFLDTKA